MEPEPGARAFLAAPAPAPTGSKSGGSGSATLYETSCKIKTFVIEYHDFLSYFRKSKKMTKNEQKVVDYRGGGAIMAPP